MCGGQGLVLVNWDEACIRFLIPLDGQGGKLTRV